MVVYQIRNKINNKVYVGQTIQSPQKRWSKHKSHLVAKTHPNPHLQNAWNKYDSNVWAFEILETVVAIEELDIIEAMYIRRLESTNPKFGYNVFAFGNIANASTRLKLQEARKRRKPTSMSVAARDRLIIRNKTRIWTSESRQKLSASLKSATHKEWSEERKENLREFNRRTKSGVTHSPETKKKISDAGKGRVHSEITKLKISSSHLGKQVSKETRKKLSDAFKGKPSHNKGKKINISPETRANLIARNKARTGQPRGMKNVHQTFI
jgi:group I intron endonuclease